jgi:hypothetical protein
MVLCGTGVYAIRYRTTTFNSRSGLRWTDTTQESTEVISSLDLALCRPGRDPRIEDPSCILRLLTVPAGQDLILRPLLQGLPSGQYMVFPRAPGGPWSAPFPVYVDMVPPARPAELEKK